MKQDFKISYSRVNTYLFCPQKYKLIYIDNLFVPVNADITFGHIIHKTLEQFCRSKNNSYDNLIDCYNSSWKNDGFISPQQTFEYYMRGNDILDNYYKSFKESKTEIIYVEKSFDANIGKYRFIGIIDRIDKYSDGTYEVMDYKTHVKSWSQEKVDKDLQLTFYAYACRNVFGFNPDEISVYFLSENKKMYTKRTQNAINKAIDIAMDVAENIMLENFEADTTKCSFCDFRFKCKYSKGSEKEGS
ncbi:MAG: PD-(D/E)XK nuclease family protein [Endomicrobium sp.]|jgi:CRISPR/Cas system-associated exonuclease Cas4 (RecB family)|nr:PD-(D/E)XK nuclease family protein [Endomicrobium sp.]